MIACHYPVASDNGASGLFQTFLRLPPAAVVPSLPTTRRLLLLLLLFLLLLLLLLLLLPTASSRGGAVWRGVGPVVDPALADGLSLRAEQPPHELPLVPHADPRGDEGQPAAAAAAVPTATSTSAQLPLLRCTVMLPFVCAVNSPTLMCHNSGTGGTSR